MDLFRPKREVFLHYFQQGYPVATILETALQDLPRFYSVYPNEEYMQIYGPSLYNFVKQLRKGYICDQTGSSIYQALIVLVRYPDLIFNYILYPSYQTRTLLPFIDNIKLLSGKPVMGYSYKRSRVMDNLWGEIGTIYRSSTLIPVIRYGTSDRGAQVLSLKLDKSSCGTFYYFEPASDIYLLLNNFIVFPNKLVAYHKLSGTSIIDIVRKVLANPNMEGLVDSISPSSNQALLDIMPLILDYSKLSILLPEDTSISKQIQKYLANGTELDIFFRNLKVELTQDWDEIITYMNNVIPKSVVVALKKYIYYLLIEAMLSADSNIIYWDWNTNFLPGAFFFDQELCLYCKELHLEAMILTTTYGPFIQTEILDVRDKKDTYDNLYMNNTNYLLNRRKNERLEYLQALNEDKNEGCGGVTTTNFGVY